MTDYREHIAQKREQQLREAERMKLWRAEAEAVCGGPE